MFKIRGAGSVWTDLRAVGYSGTDRVRLPRITSCRIVDFGASEIMRSTDADRSMLDQPDGVLLREVLV